MSNTALMPQGTAQALAVRHELDVADVIAQVKKIHLVMTEVMKEGEHYGVIPGTNKPTLLKPGAEKLLLTFRFDPQYESAETYDGKHLTVKSKCVLWHIPTSMRMGSGEGSCSTKEAKYAYRKGQRLCTECNADAIRQDRSDGGWYCWRKIGGCGAKFKAGDKNIESQQVERVPNEDLADQYNTVLKMSNKRALVAAVLNVTAASDIFTQDLEDMSEGRNHGEAVSGAVEREGGRTRPPLATQAEQGNASDGKGKRPTRIEVGPDSDKVETEITVPSDPESYRKESELNFPDPQADVERERLLNDVRRLGDSLKLKPQERLALWDATIGKGVLPGQADPAALADLKAALETRQAK